MIARVIELGLASDAISGVASAVGIGWESLPDLSSRGSASSTPRVGEWGAVETGMDTAPFRFAVSGVAERRSPLQPGTTSAMTTPIVYGQYPVQDTEHLLWVKTSTHHGLLENDALSSLSYSQDQGAADREVEPQPGYALRLRENEACGGTRAGAQAATGRPPRHNAGPGRRNGPHSRGRRSWRARRRRRPRRCRSARRAPTSRARSARSPGWAVLRPCCRRRAGRRSANRGRPASPRPGPGAPRARPPPARQCRRTPRWS